MKVKYSLYVVTLVLTAAVCPYNLYLKSGDSDWRPGFSEGEIFPICSHFSINSSSLPLKPLPQVTGDQDLVKVKYAS